MASKPGGHSLIRDPPLRKVRGPLTPRTPQDRRHWPYLRHVATVPWEISSLCSKKRHALGVNEANCHVKLKHSKLLKKSCPVIKHFITHWQQDIHSSHITNFWSSLTQTLRKKRKRCHTRQNVAHSKLTVSQSLMASVSHHWVKIALQPFDISWQ